MPTTDEFGNWDKLPIKVIPTTQNKITLDLVERRDGLAKQHEENLKNPCSLGRNWSLRQNHEGYTALNNRLRFMLDKVDS